MSQEMIISVVREWDDHPSAVLGHVVSKEDDWTKAMEEIEKMWEQFKDTEPNSDNEFIDYLAEHGFEIHQDNFVSVNLN